MEGTSFLSLLYRHKFLMIISSIIAVMITFSLTRHLTESFSSKARMATGLVDQTEAQVLDSKSDPQESKINLEFATLIQSMQLKKIFDQVSYQLMLHDLTNKETFRKKSKFLSSLNKKDINHTIEILNAKYKERENLNTSVDTEKAIEKLIESMGYDYGSLSTKVSIYRVSNSDFLDLTIDGDNPQFCAFVLNTLCSEFVTYYTQIVRETHVKGVNFLENLLEQKRDTMNEKMQVLKDYKIKNRVLNLNEQAASIYTQIADYESRKELTTKDIVAFTGAIKGIDSKFDPSDRAYIESTFIKINTEIMATKEILKHYSEAYIKSGYDRKLKVKIDSLQSVLTAQITQLTDKYIINPMSAKENLVTQKLSLQVQLDIAKNSISTYEAEIVRLNKRYDMLVPHEAVIQAYETEVDIASKEYIEILQKYNQSTLESNITPRLKQIELAVPGPAAPSKKGLLIAVSGIVPIVLYVIVLFVVFYLDDTLKIPTQLADKTNIPVLGYLPLLAKTTLNLQSIWDSTTSKREHQMYKDLLRSIRFELEQEMQENKILTITSIAPDEGKTFVALSLAYAYTMAKKKVLLIDGNFDDPSTTDITNAGYFIEDYINNTISLSTILQEDGITVMANKGEDVSLFELCSEQEARRKFDILKSAFDIIIIDASSLDNLNKSKEWIVIADKVISVYEANKSISAKKDLQINYLRELDKKYIGWILNKVQGHKSRLKALLQKLKKSKKKRKVK